ncbi:hypothetical protein IFY68_05655 (plasmid) [Klebsiella pneumoniae]|uniref:hypothetical protein n=1 Tax=Klebsiella/Raoultella group TaxID=2890311 RepID=UPI000BFB2D17|nr:MULTISPECIES: hypothetical protein [Klebsiella]MDH8498523.1 hypothetical protein [Klebsiella pneumoniae]PHH11782.1 hypothetical protein CRX54_29050 [Klebsiella oxytoca]QRC83612.1 hypothetical protein IFY68_05655 [Klebsiella pneumoniae]HED3233482.1 hypothetical protein [Klebsiella oxytoca]HED3474452.1 hypothetical protein [Klebsiella oxytoca]
MKIEITPAQLEAIRELTDDCASMIGCGEDDSDRIWLKRIRLIDRMLTKNGYQRDFYKEVVTDADEDKL